MSKGLKIDLLIIDPQNDFCVPNTGQPQAYFQGSLAVPGADKDMDRLATFVKNVGNRLNDIHVTLDTHRTLDIAHPGWWRRTKDELVNGAVMKAGTNPNPFTVITSKDLDPANPKWESLNAYMTKRSTDYINALEAKKRYPHMVWPEHCLIGSIGNEVYKPLWDALHNWERTCSATVDYVTKGSNPYTEHFSAVQAEVPDPKDPDTALNTVLVDMLDQCQQLVIAGEALSHCLAFTVRDIDTHFTSKGQNFVQKIVLLEDCASSVTGFEQHGQDFIRDMKLKGMKVVKSTDFMQTQTKATVTA